MNKIKTFFETRFFAPVSPERLAIIRIATGIFSLWYLLSRFDMLQRMTKNTDAFEPVGILWFMKEPLNTDVFWWLSVSLIVLNLFYIVGLKFKITGPAFAVLALLFFTYRNSWSMVYHNRNALVLHILILGLVASADAWSLDAWRSKLRERISNKANWRYGWPIMLICAVTAGSYFLSGIAKVAGELALDWANGSAMRSQIAVDALRKSILGAEIAPLFDLLYKHTWLFFGMGIFTFIIELGAPLALLRSRWGKVWAVLTIGMHWGIFAIMGIRFRYQMTGLIFLSFFEPEKWLDKTFQKVSSKDQGVESHASLNGGIILFDGECSLCNTWVRFVLKNEKNLKFGFVSLQSAKAEELLKPYGVSNSLNSILLIRDGHLYHKSSAVLRILSTLRLPWPLLTLLMVIPHFIRDVVYDLVAKNRYKWFGKQNECAIMGREEKLRFLE